MATKFLDFIQNQDAVSFKEAFQESVSAKVITALEAKKQEVASAIFKETSHLGIEGHEGGGFTGKGTPHSGHPSKGWPKAPAAGSAHDTGSKEHPAKHGEKVQTKFQKHHTDSAAHMDAVHADLSKHHHQHHMEEGHDKHEKKHAKLHHKLAKKMLKHAHKHGKKHHEEE